MPSPDAKPIFHEQTEVMRAMFGKQTDTDVCRALRELSSEVRALREAVTPRQSRFVTGQAALDEFQKLANIILK